MRTTRAAVLEELGGPIPVRELQVPVLRAGQVLVRVAYSGVCHTQLNEVRGRKGPDRYLPHTLGHEGSGVVVETGEGVTKVSPGDRVVLTWIKCSGADISSTRYESPEGPVNSGALSTLTELSVVSENRLVKLPQDAPLREGALLGCALLTGIGVVSNTARVHEGASVAIFGAGGIGLSAILGARLAKASMIVAVDVSDSKLALATGLGATHAVNAARDDPVEAIRRLVPGGVDRAIEAAGRRDAMEAAFRSVKDAGGIAVIAGNLPPGEMIRIDPFDLIKGKRLVGTWGGESRPDDDIPRLVRLLLDEKVPWGDLITHEFDLDDVGSAFRELEAGRVGRALVRIGGEGV